MPVPLIQVRLPGAPSRALPPRAGVHSSRNMKCACTLRRF
jgi:hypothetical protein